MYVLAAAGTDVELPATVFKPSVVHPESVQL